MKNRLNLGQVFLMPTHQHACKSGLLITNTIKSHADCRSPQVPCPDMHRNHPVTHAHLHTYRPFSKCKESTVPQFLLMHPELRVLLSNLYYNVSYLIINKNRCYLLKRKRLIVKNTKNNHCYVHTIGIRMYIFSHAHSNLHYFSISVCCARALEHLFKF